MPNSRLDPTHDHNCETIAGTYLSALSDLLIDAEVISRSDQHALWVVGRRSEFF